MFIPLFFGGNFFDYTRYPALLLGFLSFGMVASSIYIINDYRDIEADRKHPKKSLRPLASGKVSKRNALVIFVVLVLLGFFIAIITNPKFAFILGIYFLMNIGYCFGLKNISILDMFLVAIGFVLRVKSGGVLASIAVSNWLIVMIFLLALFIAIAKRRDDIVLKEASGIDMRKTVKKYNLSFLNACLTLISGITIVSYLMYAISPDVVARMGNHGYRLYYTSIFVVAGIFRYLQLALVENNTGSPTELLYKDRFIQAVIFLWLVSFYFIIYSSDFQLFDS